MITLAPPRGGGGITARGVPGQRRCQGSWHPALAPAWHPAWHALAPGPGTAWHRPGHPRGALGHVGHAGGSHARVTHTRTRAHKIIKACARASHAQPYARWAPGCPGTRAGTRLCPPHAGTGSAAQLRKQSAAGQRGAETVTGTRTAPGPHFGKGLGHHGACGHVSAARRQHPPTPRLTKIIFAAYLASRARAWPR